MRARSTTSSDKAAKAVKADDPQQLYWRDVERAAKGKGTGKAEAAGTAVHGCDHPGCQEPGTHRAPKSRTALRDFYWFCLAHVQAYNKSWNYYSGLSIDDMEDVRRQDMVGWRPTWPLGKLGAGDRNKDISPDALRAHIFTQFFDNKTRRTAGAAGTAGGGAVPAALDLLPEERAALLSFELPLKANWVEIKARYKVLALQYHPDRLAGGATQMQAQNHDDQIKLINRAYAVLKRRQQRLTAASV